MRNDILRFLAWETSGDVFFAAMIDLYGICICGNRELVDHRRKRENEELGMPDRPITFPDYTVWLGEVKSRIQYEQEA